MAVRLSAHEKRIRNILIETAKATLATRSPGSISYKELWGRISTRKWGRARKDEIVPAIIKISAFELEHSRPPLNELVVVTRTGEPGEPWLSIKSSLRKNWHVLANYDSHPQAQEACWRYWRAKFQRTQDEDGVEEGLQQDRTTSFRRRNATMIAKRKAKDDYTCQACSFRLRVNGRYIIDCHHKFPFRYTEGVRITRIDDIVCLCPTCHRIAHTKSEPLDVSEIKRLRRS